MLRLALLGILGPLVGAADQRFVAAAPPEPSPRLVRAAVERAIPLLEKGARGSMEQRPQCFTCHNQGVPLLALTTARERGFVIDKEHYQAQLAFTAQFLDKNRANYLKGKGQGGQVDTAGYALWTLGAGGWKPDATTDAVLEYLLQFNQDLPHWRVSARRPPSEQSQFTANYLALRALRHFESEAISEKAEKRIAKVRNWLEATPPQDTEDRVFRLWGLKVAGAADPEIQQAARELFATQRPDGGWGQLDLMESDPYATGTALVALHQAAGLPVTDPVYRRGLIFLLCTQLSDGSWYVRSRSSPFQTYFESGFPHGKHQFISMAASAWATMALALAVE